MKIISRQGFRKSIKCLIDFFKKDSLPSYRICLTAAIRNISPACSQAFSFFRTYKSHSKHMHVHFSIALFLTTAVSRILASPFYRQQSVELCNAGGPCTGSDSLCCSATTVLLCNDAGMLQTSNCAAGGICVNMSDTLAQCQQADVCDDVGNQCSTQIFLTKCCADRTRFVACMNDELSILQCGTKESCINDGLVVRCQ
jgi:hypothetical protein